MSTADNSVADAEQLWIVVRDAEVLVAEEAGVPYLPSRATFHPRIPPAIITLIERGDRIVEAAWRRKRE